MYGCGAECCENFAVGCGAERYGKFCASTCILANLCNMARCMPRYYNLYITYDILPYIRGYVNIYEGELYCDILLYI